MHFTKYDAQNIFIPQPEDAVPHSDTYLAIIPVPMLFEILLLVERDFGIATTSSCMEPRLQN